MKEIEVEEEKLRFFFESLMLDPVAIDHLLVDAYANCAVDGKLYESQLVKFLSERDIAPGFLDIKIEQSTVVAKPESSAEPAEQTPAQPNGMEEKTIQPAAVKEALPQNVSPAPETPLLSVADGQRTRIPVNVPTSLWAGKAPQAIFDYLSRENFAPEVIAYILMKKDGGVSKTDAGRMFYREAIDKGIEQDPRTYQRKIDDLLKEAKSKYSFTFEG